MYNKKKKKYAYFSPNNYVFIRKRGTRCVASKLRGHTLRGPKLRWAQIEGSKTPWDKFAFNLYPRILDQCETNIRIFEYIQINLD